MKYCLILIIGFFIVGCKEQKSTRKDNVFEFNAKNILVSETIDVDQICDSCSYIPLETVDSALIGEIIDIKLTDNRIIVRDGQKLLVFNRKGKFLNKIGKRGRGPGEYSAMRNFYINGNHEIVVFDPILLSLHFYTLDNQFIKSIDIRKAVLILSSEEKETDSMIEDIYPYNDSLLFFAHRLSRFSDILYSLFNLHTGELKVISRLDHVISMKADSWLYSSLPVAQNGKKLTCIMPFNNILYQFADTCLMPVYAVNPIPKQEISENYLANRKTKNNTQLEEECGRHKYVMPINVMESENNLIIENAVGGKSCYLFWNKNNQQGFFAELNSIDPNKIPLLIVREMFLDICVGWWEVMQIKEKCAYAEKSGQIISDPLKRLNEQLDDNDNPVIILNYLKKNWTLNEIQ